MKNLFLILSVIGFLLISCSHTNNLSKFDIDKKNFYFEHIVSAEAGRVDIVYTSDAPKKKDEDKANVGTIIGDIAQAIGTAILTSETENKLLRAANPNDIAHRVSDGVREVIMRYVNIIASEKIDENTNFIVTTTLEECQIHSSPYGVTLRLSANSKIIERNTGALVWENCEAENIPLRRRYLPSSETKTGKMVSDIAQATELATLSEEELKEAINRAAIEIGRLFGETFREDLAEARSKKQ